MSNETPSIPEWQNRTELLFGEGSYNRLAQSSILIAGAGGVGGFAAEMLVRAGIGRVLLLDGDIVEKSNCNRQLIALNSTLGRPKTEVWKERLLDINPDLELIIKSDFYAAKEEWSLLLENHAPFDCVLDAIDTLSPKVALIEAVLEKKIPLVSCMGSGARMDPEKIRTADIGKTFGCPLASAVRSRLRKDGINKGFSAVFSTENAIRSAIIESFSRNKRSTVGTVSYMPAAFGCHCAAAVIKKILQK